MEYGDELLDLTNHQQEASQTHSCRGVKVEASEASHGVKGEASGGVLFSLGPD